ncbi:hypothetical protein T492DRAFT_1146879 [Pavlovales sp. CCMP2436]|nr:hypothetical protein T492DRAFT_1146879 [Pavlovales sp. CCMP2436]
MAHILAALLVAASLGLPSAAEPKPSIKTDDTRVARRLRAATNCNGRTYFSLVIKPDAWPDEISWTLLDNTNSRSVPVANGGAESRAGCLSDGRYSFTFYDTFGDGLLLARSKRTRMRLPGSCQLKW